jgi:endonuclease/exonuclease/phosphatase family metal-dependent hydrolase
MMKIQLLQKVVFILAFLLLFTNPLRPYEITPPERTYHDKNPGLKILTWNIYMLPHCSWFHDNCKRARFIAGKLKSSDYDIIMFEEAFDRRPRNILKEALKAGFPYIYGPANYSFFSVRANSGLWILSKIPLRRLEEIEFANRYGIDAMSRKGAILFQGSWNGQPFQLACTHLQADSPDTIRREQCKEVASLLKKYYITFIPQITCGDFNIEFDDQKNYKLMLSSLDSENGKLIGEFQSSYDEIGNELARKINGKSRLIDYILVRNASLFKSITRKVRVFKGNQNNKTFSLSDHYGIEALIDFY